MNWKHAAAVTAVLAMALLAWLGRGWYDKATTTTSVTVKHDTTTVTLVVEKKVPYKVAVHDTVTVHDTLMLRAVAPTLAAGGVVVGVDTTIAGAHLQIAYALPDTLNPLGVFLHISVSYPRIIDSIRVVEYVPEGNAWGWLVYPAYVATLILGYFLGRGL